MCRPYRSAKAMQTGHSCGKGTVRQPRSCSVVLSTAGSTHRLHTRPCTARYAAFPYPDWAIGGTSAAGPKPCASLQIQLDEYEHTCQMAYGTLSSAFAARERKHRNPHPEDHGARDSDLPRRMSQRSKYMHCIFSPAGLGNLAARGFDNLCNAWERFVVLGHQVHGGSSGRLTTLV